ncbi:MAG: hypothetical protein WC628_03630 [Candidatus Omnitrophota bacterium]
MIEINLLPDELKALPKKVKSDISNIIEARYLKLAIPFVLGLLILTHIILITLGAARNNNFRAKNSDWDKLLPQRKAQEEFKKEYSLLTQDVDTLKKLAASRINLSEKLNTLASVLPSGVWFNQLILSPNELVLSCSVLALNKDDLGLINQFIDALKKDPVFFKDFNTLDLSSVQKKTLGSYEVSDFNLVFSLKPKS